MLHLNNALWGPNSFIFFRVGNTNNCLISYIYTPCWIRSTVWHKAKNETKMFILLSFIAIPPAGESVPSVSTKLLLPIVHRLQRIYDSETSWLNFSKIFAYKTRPTIFSERVFNSMMAMFSSRQTKHFNLIFYFSVYLTEHALDGALTIRCSKTKGKKDIMNECLVERAITNELFV